MSEFLDSCVLWVVDYRLDGHARRWIRAFMTAQPVRDLMLEELDELYGERAALLGLRQADEAERSAYLRGEAPQSAAPSLQ